MSRPLQARRARSGLVRCGALIVIAVAVAACEDRRPTPLELLEVGAIVVEGGPTIMERGTRDTLRATVVDRAGDTVDVPVVWRSSNETIARFERGGLLLALDTGIVTITASSLGVTSTPVPYRVVWRGPAYLDTASWSRPHALNPGSTLTDSVRVRVINVDSQPVPNAKVRFTVTAGGGSVSPAIATTDANGIAASQWTLGSDIGTNTVTASVLRADSTVDPLVKDNALATSIVAYRALTVAAGDAQTAQILSQLPDAPSVRLVDSTGAPRPGVPVQFVASANGQVVTPTVSTNASGVATPGKWTLGDIPGGQFLEARVGDARVRLTATATGTPIHYKPSSVHAGAFATCAVESDGSAKCWGEVPQHGAGDTSNVFQPVPVKATVTFATIASGSSHLCGVSTDAAIWCWGTNALADTTGATVHSSVPRKLGSSVQWTRVSPGFAHNCAIDLAQNAWCWGLNSTGQLGDGTLASRFTPAMVPGGFRFSQISAGPTHTCGLTVAGSAFCWGANQSGQLGDGTTDQRTGVTAVGGGHTFQAIGTGDGYSCGLSTAGVAWCWGAITGTPRLTPTSFTGAPTFVSLTAGGGHACALTGDGTAYCWGVNTFGQVGDSTVAPRRATPQRVAGDLKYLEISAGFQHTCARTQAGAVVCWGRNRGGELADNTVTQRATPRHVVLGVQP